MRIGSVVSRRSRSSDLVPFAILAAMVVVIALLPALSDYHVRTANVYNVLQNFASYGVVALALGVTMIAAEFDLSVSSMYLLGGMVAVLTGSGSPLAGVLAALGVAVVVGLVQGALIARFRLNSMPVTLGGYLIVLGITYILGHGKSVLYENYSVGLRLDQPVAQIFSIRSIVALGIFAVVALALRYLRFGRDIRATGGDRRAARVAGVPVDRLLIAVFVFSAVGAALPGALLSYSLATASPTNIGFDVLTFSATAALIGGVSLSGGRGSAFGIAAGVLSLSILQEILSIMRSPDYVSSLITGALLVVVTVLWAPELLRWFKTAAPIKARPVPAEASSEPSANS